MPTPGRTSGAPAPPKSLSSFAMGGERSVPPSVDTSVRPPLRRASSAGEWNEGAEPPCTSREGGASISPRTLGRGSAAALALAIFAVTVGCEDRTRPWSGRDGPVAVLAPPPAPQTGEPVAIDPTGALTSTESAGASATPSGSALDPGLLPPPGTVVAAPSVAPIASLLPAGEPLPEIAPGHAITPGGLWVRCYEGLALSGDPLKDVTRLGLVCGPSNGLRRKTKQAIVGIVTEGEPPVSHELRVAKGACYRVLAVGDAGVVELDVTIRSSRDVAVAGDHARGRLAIVQPDRPFCTFADETFTATFSAIRGSGRFAAEVWSIGEPRKAGEPETPDERPMDDP